MKVTKWLCGFFGVERKC